MRKIDFHIHTIPSEVKAENFVFDIARLKEYVMTMGIDAIAITNHNLFDKNQYQSIKALLSRTVVFPGIEVDLCGGHVLVISDSFDVDDLEAKANVVSNHIQTDKDYIDLQTFESIFTDLSKYILIPHYDKDPKIPKNVITALSEYITAGEVTSPKKFMYAYKDTNSLVPVLFSDSRLSTSEPLPSRQTYIDVGDITLKAIKEALKDRRNVALDPDAIDLIDINNGEIKISTGLNVILGRRSSGKTHTLKAINSLYGGDKHVKYIKQFSLVNGNENDSKNTYDSMLAEKKNSLFEDFIELFRDAVNDIISINSIEEDNIIVDDYLRVLKATAKDESLKDCFSKCKLFHDYSFDIAKPDTLKTLISSVLFILDNIEFKTIIDSYLNRSDLQALLLRLENELEKALELYNKKRWANMLMQDINKQLQYNSSTESIPDISYSKIASNRIKRAKFLELCYVIKREVEITTVNMAKFKIQAKSRTFVTATDMKSDLGRQVSMVDAYKMYNDPLAFVQCLKDKPEINNSEIYKFFVTIDYKILNRYNLEVSGGEQSEYNLLNSIQDAKNYDMLLIDEPESSFDNIFLKDNVNTMLNSLAEEMPVIVVTHNNTIGGSIHPNYLLYTEKVIEEGKPQFTIYYGHPGDKKLVSKDGKEIDNYTIQLDSLEAGQKAYNERNKTYENIKN
jgi:Fe-S cluster assembly ATPase SufC